MEAKFLSQINEGGVYVPEPYVKNNYYLTKPCDSTPVPTFEEVREALPKPVWEGHESTIDCYYKAWQLAFKNCHKAKKEAGFVSNFIDTAFNGFLFMWDSSFIVMFGKYASHLFDFQKTLDNFYAHQHKDGFICREICEDRMGEMWPRFDPCSTGPNILPLAEWLYFEQTNDVDRLSKVFDPLMGYHNWLRSYRTWPDGTYWSSGWGCGMDDQPRMEPQYNVSHHHGFMSWIDICAQQYMSAQILCSMAKVLGREDETKELREESQMLAKAVDGMWDEKTAFYYDKYRDGSLGKCKSVGAYWTLLAGLVPKERRDSFVAHLDNEEEFKRKYRVTTLSADDPEYRLDFPGWRGAIWAPTNYMVLMGLRKYGYEKMANEIALCYVDQVTKAFEKTGTLWEHYRPEEALPSTKANKDFVGWTGLAPISVLFEYVFGLEPDAANHKITWQLNTLEKHGVENYRLGDTTLTILCEARKSADEEPVITLKSDKPVTVEVFYGGKHKTIHS